MCLRGCIRHCRRPPGKRPVTIARNVDAMWKVPHMSELLEIDCSVGSRTSPKNGSFRNWTVWTTCMAMMSTSQTQVSRVCRSTCNSVKKPQLANVYVSKNQGWVAATGVFYKYHDRVMATIDIAHERLFVKVDSGTNIRKFTAALTNPILWTFCGCGSNSIRCEACLRTTWRAPWSRFEISCLPVHACSSCYGASDAGSSDPSCARMMGAMDYHQCLSCL